jgi:hypothetical protein
MDGIICKEQGETGESSQAHGPYAEPLRVSGKVAEHTWSCSAIFGSVDVTRTMRVELIYLAGLYLTDVTFCREGNSDKRISPYDNTRTLLNFDKYRRLAAIADGA